MTARWEGADEATRRPERGVVGAYFSERPRLDGRRVLAVALTAVMLLSVVAVPVASAPPNDTGPSGGNGGGGADAGSNGNAGGGNSNAGDSGPSGSENSGASSSNSGGGDSSNSGSSNSANGGNSGASTTDGGNGGSSGSNGGGNPDAGSSNSNAGSSRGSSAGSAQSGANDPPGRANDDDRGRDREAGAPARANGGQDRGNGGPSVDVSVGGPADAGQGRSADAPGRSDGERRGPAGEPDPPSVVDVSVTGAQSGDSVSVDVSPPSVEEDDVAFDGVSVTVKRDGDFTLQVTNSRERLPGSPVFEPDAAAEPLGRIRLGHSITNEEVEDVSFDFRVSKDRLLSTGTDPEEVALYRYADGDWTALRTDVVGETSTHYLLAADSPGMSEFAVGAKRPDFETFWADASATTVASGEEVTVSGRVSNVGGADGVYEATLVVDGVVVDRKQVTVAAGGTRQVNFDASFDGSGTHEVYVDDVHAADVAVADRPPTPRLSDVGDALTLAFARILRISRLAGATPALASLPS